MKHEKAFLVILAYIIGFTTAFIGFGLPIDLSGPERMVDANFPVPTEEASTATIVDAYSSDEGLFAVVGGEEMMISAKDMELEVPVDNYHYGVPIAAISPNGEFVHYCEQSLEVPTECQHFVYVGATHDVYRVTHQSSQMISDITETRSGWQPDSTLAIEGVTSVSAEEPWILE